MVFVTSLDILDTGFLDVATRTNQLGAASRVNSGSALRLRGVNIDVTWGSAIDKAVSPGFVPTSVKAHEKRARISVNPATIRLTIFLNADHTDTTNIWEINDVALLSSLISLPTTAGWKALYYPVDNTATDVSPNTTRKRDSQLIKQLGETDTTEGQGDIDITIWTGAASASSKDLTDVNYIPVRFESITMNQAPGNKIKVVLNAVITG